MFAEPRGNAKHLEHVMLLHRMETLNAQAGSSLHSTTLRGTGSTPGLFGQKFGMASVCCKDLLSAEDP